jgi:tetratricopeptide (TPR) repeat protein
MAAFFAQPPAHITQIADAQSAAPIDSLDMKLEAVRALREQRTLEGRQQALHILEVLKSSTIAETPAYLMEEARTLEASGFHFNAQASYRQVLKLDPANLDARTELCTTLFNDMFQHISSEHLAEISNVLGGAIHFATAAGDSVKPEQFMSIYYLASLECFHRRRTAANEVERAAWSRKGYDFTAPLLDRYSQYAPASLRLLHAIHCMDLGLSEEADASFKEAIANMPAHEADKFKITPQLASVPGYTSLSPSEKLQTAARYWQQFTDPMSAENNMQLNFWYNVACATIYCTNPDNENLSGAESTTGRAMARFGVPGAVDYFPGGPVAPLTSSVAPPSQAKPLRWANPRMRFQYVGGHVLDFEYLQGEGWHPTPPTQIMLKFTERPDFPPVYVPHEPGTIEGIAISQVAYRGTSDQKDRVACYISVPAWSAEAEWWKGAAYDLNIYPEREDKVASSRQAMIKETHIQELASNRQVLVLGGDSQLAPGRYKAVFEIKKPEGNFSGAKFGFFTVPEFNPGTFELSELQMTAGESHGKDAASSRYVPNPTRTLDFSASMRFAFTMYELTSNERGEKQYQTTVQLVPADYRTAYERLRRSNALAAPDSASFAVLGHKLGGTELTFDNFAEVQYPPVTVPRLQGDPSQIEAYSGIDASQLADGRYVLRLTVEDLVAHKQAVREMVCYKVGAADLDRIYGPVRK